MGVSASFLLKKLQKQIDEQNLSIRIVALGTHDLEKYVLKNYSQIAFILFAPHCRSSSAAVLTKLDKMNIKPNYLFIKMSDYGTMNSENILADVFQVSPLSIGS